jgi:hypothetical protein
VGKEFCANLAGAETFGLDANNNGAKRRVYFLKSYRQERICENLLKKRAKKKTGNRWGSE